MAYDRDTGSSNTAIFGIVALVIVGLLVFFLFFRDGGQGTENNESDVTLNIDPQNDQGDGAEPLLDEGDVAPPLQGDGGEPQPQDRP